VANEPPVHPANRFLTSDTRHLTVANEPPVHPANRL